MAREEVRTDHAIEEMVKDAMRHVQTILDSDEPVEDGQRLAAIWDGRWIMALELGLPYVAHVAARGEALVRSAYRYRMGMSNHITEPSLLGWEESEAEDAA